jgi:hypothetical protein
VPNLPGRYAYSVQNEPEAVETVGVSAESSYKPCAGECGTLVTTNKCTECATRAVLEWRASKK